MHHQSSPVKFRSIPNQFSLSNLYSGINHLLGEKHSFFDMRQQQKMPIKCNTNKLACLH
jgi:hypothetical protein